MFSRSPNDGTVVTVYDRNNVAYINTVDDMKWTTVEIVPWYTGDVLIDLVFDDAGGGKVYCLDSHGVVRVLHIPAGGRNHPEPAVESSLSAPGAAVLAPPYNLARASNLFFCHGSLHQVWQNGSGTVRSRNGSTMSEDEIFVLRYGRGRRQDCWDKVKDLGG